jgi:hypothetical protein
MQFIAHRVNAVAQLRQVPAEYGVELDLRDHGDRLILQHDPFKAGEDFGAYLDEYRHGTMILNVKSEGIEYRVLDELRRAGTVRDYFFLDCTFPMIRKLVRQGERHVAVRYSEYEPLAGVLALAGEVEWVWVDCFSHLPLDRDRHARLAEHFKICVVSPELQGHDLEGIRDFAAQLRDLPVEAVCTKRPDLWQAALGITRAPSCCT